MRYSVDSGQPVIYGYPAYGYASYGPVWGWAPYYGPGGRVHYLWTATYPVGYGVVGTSYSQAIALPARARVDITDPPRRRHDGRRRLFEGTVVSEGESASLAPVMPAMVRALFSDFPGPSGVSRRVQVRLDDAPTTAGASAPAAASVPAAVVPAEIARTADAGRVTRRDPSLPGNSATGTATGRNLPTVA